MKGLSSTVKIYIIQRLACFDYPSEVAKAVKEEYGIDISRQAVEANDPTKVAGRDMAKKWRDLFNEIRKKFLTDISDTAISHKAVRLRRLDRMAQKAEAKGNIVLAASLYEQAAKEVGNVHSNRRDLTGKEGNPLKLVPSDMTDEQLDARLLLLLPMRNYSN